MQRQQEQIDTVFDDNKMVQTDQQIELLITHFDSQSDQYYDYIDDQLRQPVESINNHMIRLINQYKQIQSTRIDDNQQTIITINSIKQNYDQIINQTQQIIKQQHNRYDQMMMKHDGRLEQIQQLKQCGNVVNIDKQSNLDICRKKIEDYQYDNKEYQIVVDFGSVDTSSIFSIDHKMDMLEIIDTLNANSKVGRVWIGVSITSSWNDQILSLITNRYTNVYWIAVFDWNNSVDHQIHDLIKQYVQQQPIMKFVFWFFETLHNNNDGCELMKQYNQLIKQKQYLECLEYEYDRIGGYRYVDTKQEIKELIDQIDKS